MMWRYRGGGIDRVCCGLDLYLLLVPGLVREKELARVMEMEMEMEKAPGMERWCR